MKDLEHFNFHRIEKTKMLHERLDRYYNKKYKAKRKKLRENLNIEEKVLVLTERIQKKSPWKFSSNLYRTLLTLIEKNHFLLERNKK